MTLLLCILGALIVASLIIIIIDCNRFVVTDYEISNPLIKADRNIVVLSDLHNKEFGRNNIKLINKINEINPDFIICTGDILTAHKNRSFAPALNLMRELSAKYKIYYGIGNHEYRLKLYPEDYGNSFYEYIGSLKDLGITVLENESISLDRLGISITGLEMDKYYYRRLTREPMDDGYLPSVIGNVSQDEYNILLAHDPEYFDAYAKWGAELTLSGHVHGGLVRLPFVGGMVSPKIRFFPKYDSGLFDISGKKMIVSNGLGTHTVPIRIFNPGQIVLLKLRESNT